MNDAVWLKLAKRINQRLAAGEVDGIVVTHGTDTMEETAYFIELVTTNKRPIVFRFHAARDRVRRRRPGEPV